MSAGSVRIPRTYALVTGASSGIGVHLAKQLAARGFGVILVARRVSRLEALAEEIRRTHGVDAVVVPQDLAAGGAATALYEAACAADRRVGVLVNNAGFGMQGRFLDMEMAEVERMFRVNATVVVQMTQSFARRMAARGGGFILNVASAAAFLPSPYVAAYAATKAYVSSFSEALRFELRGTQVSLTTLYPGITGTEFNAVAKATAPWLMAPSILSADAVARAGLNGMFARRRSVVPGMINKLNVLLCRALPRGLVVEMAGRLMRRANDRR